MPRYFFDVHDGVSVPDKVGTKLPDIYAAQTEAIRFSGEVLRDAGARFWNNTEWALKVFDEHRTLLFVLRFSAEEPGLDSSSGQEIDRR